MDYKKKYLKYKNKYKDASKMIGGGRKGILSFEKKLGDSFISEYNISNYKYELIIEPKTDTINISIKPINKGLINANITIIPEKIFGSTYNISLNSKIYDYLTEQIDKVTEMFGQYQTSYLPQMTESPSMRINSQIYNSSSDPVLNFIKNPYPTRPLDPFNAQQIGNRWQIYWVDDKKILPSMYLNPNNLIGVGWNQNDINNAIRLQGLENSIRFSNNDVSTFLQNPELVGPMHVLFKYHVPYTNIY